MVTKIESEFSFQKPAVYKIKVEGEIQANWSEKFQGLKIKVERSLRGKPVSVLTGKIIDLGGVHYDGKRTRKCSQVVASGKSLEVFVDDQPLHMAGIKYLTSVQILFHLCQA